MGIPPIDYDPNESPLGYLMRKAQEREKKLARKIYILGLFVPSKSGLVGSINIFLN